MKPLLLFLGATVVLTACSSNPASAPTDGGTRGDDAGAALGAHPSDAASAADGDGAAACNALANTAAVVPVTQIASEPPDPEGGAIADGTYEMTGVTIYTGVDGPTGASGTSQTTIEVAGTTVQVVSAGQPPTRTVTLATHGTAFTATDSCPDDAVTQGSYTADGSALVIYLDGGTDDAGARTVAETFAKQ